MDKGKIIKTTQEQATSEWINYLYMLRVNSVIEALEEQKNNVDGAFEELKKIGDFINNPQHILGNKLTKHGEIAEYFQVYVSNAFKILNGEKDEYTFENVNRTAPVDYLKDGVPVQSKFCNGPYDTWRALTEHSDKYPGFMKNENGIYEIPKNQWNNIKDIYNRGYTSRSSLTRSEETLFKGIREWETKNNVKFDEKVQPAIVNYEDVQINRAPKTLEDVTNEIKAENEDCKQKIYNDNRPTVKEGLKTAGTAAFLEGGTAGIYKILSKVVRDGKKITDFNKDDWKEIGIDTGVGTIKGGIRGTSLYYLINNKNISAPMANAVVTATFGIVAETMKFYQKKITIEELYNNSTTICIEVAISAISTTIGSKIIPIPILGGIIGNIAGMTVYSIVKDYISNEEIRFIKEKNKQLEEFQSKMDQEFIIYSNMIKKKISEYHDIISYAFDEDVNVAFESSIKAARYVGVPDEKLLLTEEDCDNYFMNS